MSRKSKFTKEVTERILILIRDGYTVSDVCRGARISTDTFYRWCDKYPDFHKAVVEATDLQWYNKIKVEKGTYFMSEEVIPNPNKIHPIAGYDKEIYIKPTITKPNVIVGDFTYIADADFESHISHHYDFVGDKLTIGKFCQIAAGVEFIMNGANHQRNAVTTFPFYTLEGWKQDTPPETEMGLKGDTVIGNDVWIGQNVTFLPGVKVGDGAIIGANTVVRDNVEPYTIVIGNPAEVLRKRFDDDLIELLERFKWWDKSISEIQTLIPLLTNSNLRYVKSELEQLLK